VDLARHTQSADGVARNKFVFQQLLEPRLVLCFHTTPLATSTSGDHSLTNALAVQDVLTMELAQTVVFAIAFHHTEVQPVLFRSTVTVFSEELESQNFADVTRETPLALDATDNRSDQNTTSAVFAAEMDQLATSFAHTTAAKIVQLLRDAPGALVPSLTVPPLEVVASS